MAFEGKGSVLVLKEKLARAVAVRYPDSEPDTPLHERKGSIPPAVLRMIEEQQKTREERHRIDKKQPQVCLDKKRNPQRRSLRPRRVS